MINVDALSFDLTDCKALPSEDKLERCWVGPPNVINQLRFRQDDKPYWHFDLTDLKAATRHFAQQCKDNGGVMLSLRFKQSGHLEILHGLFKYRSPFENKRAMYYVGIMWIPFREGIYQLNLEAVETGTTGMRECAVMVLNPDGWPKPPDDEIKVINSLEELQAMDDDLGSQPAVRFPSDEPQYDSMFPRHPLSMVRARLATVVKTAKVTTSRPTHPYRMSDY